MSRPSTPAVIDGARTVVTVQRYCDGCGEKVGNATDEELECAAAGRPLPSVVDEHGCGAP